MVDDAVECEAKASVVLQEISRRQDDATRSLMKITIDDIGRAREAEHTDAVKELNVCSRTGPSVQCQEQAHADTCTVGETDADVGRAHVGS